MTLESVRARSKQLSVNESYTGMGGLLALREATSQFVAEKYNFTVSTRG